jgi:hypothetical protein
MRDDEQNPLDYASPAPRAANAATPFGITLYLGLICLLTLAIGWFILPQFQKTLAEMNAPLPAITVGFSTVTQWLVRFPGVIVLLLVPILIPRVIGRFIHRTGDPDEVSRRTTIAYVGITLLAGAVVAITVLSVFLPLMGLVEPFNRQSGGQ